MLLQENLTGLGKVAVALSGGVDSSFLLWTATKVLGDAVFAVLVRSCLLKKEEIEAAERFAASCRCRFLPITVAPLSWPEFVANPANRCYHCKKRLFQLVGETVQDGYQLIDGTNFDDLSADRPGLRALAEAGVRSPLAEAGLTKAEVRELSRQVGLCSWNRPSSSCLATRIPAGTPVREELLQLIAAAELFLENLGFAGCRVRVAGAEATVVVETWQVERLFAENCRRQVIDYLQGLGFARVLLDRLGRACV